MYAEDKVLIVLVVISLAVSTYLIHSYGFQPLYIFISSALILLSFLPYSIIKFIETKKIKEMEAHFPDFLRDLSESIKAGMTLVDAFKFLSKTEYGALSKEIRRTAVRLNWITIKDAIHEMRDRLSRSKLISRALDILLEAYISGGNLSKTLDSLSRATYELKSVEDDRKAILSEQSTMIIVISLIFIGISVALFKLIVPIIAAQTGQYMSFLRVGEVSIDYYRQLFFVAIVVQSIMGGILAGYVSDNNFAVGMRNAIVLLGISLLIYGVGILPKNVAFDVNTLSSTVKVGSYVELIGSFYVDGNPVKNATILVNGQKYYTNDKGQFDILYQTSERGNLTLHVVGIKGDIKAEKTLVVEVV